MTETFENGIASLHFNRPASRNAIDAQTVEAMAATLARLGSDRSVRAIVLRGGDEAFCAGVDIAWMQHMSRAGTVDDARRVAHLLLQLRNLDKPTVAVLEGPCIGGGVAIAACCDIALASEEASFALPAVHLGVVPAIIAPFIAEAIGTNQARRWLLTGERFSALRAREIGLIHAVCMAAQIEETLSSILDGIRRGGPKTIAATKDTLTAIAGKPITAALMEDMARRVAGNRRNAEAAEGLDAFLEKRLPSWRDG